MLRKRWLRGALLLLLAAALLLAGCVLIADESTFAAFGELDLAASEFYVCFFDVGQADAALVYCQGQTMLIDGGNVADGPLLQKWLKELGINYLDVVISTHAHEDHVGGLALLLDEYDAGRVLSPVSEYNSNAFRNFLLAVEQADLQLEIAVADQQFKLGEAMVTLLAPRHNYADANNSSIVLRVDYGRNSFLFTADAEYDSEQDMLAADCVLQADVLKVGHHGSGTSTSYLFLREVRPDYAVISVGRDNDYGHPHEQVTSRLADADVAVFRTDLQGTIICTSDGAELTFYAEKSQLDQSVDGKPTADSANSSSYIGNLKSLKFHLTSCPNLPARHNRILFESRQDALAAGYEACGNCKP